MDQPGNQTRSTVVGTGMRTSFRLLVVPAAFLVLLVAACGSDSQKVIADPGGTTTTTPGGDHPPTDPPPSVFNVSREATDIVFQVNDCCGFVPAEIALGSVPSLTIMGDATVISVGPTTEQYPPHALPNLQRSDTSPTAIDSLIKQAMDAGLLEDGLDFGQPGITDQSTTTVTMTFDGTTHTISAYALGAGYPDGVDSGLTAQQVKDRGALSALIEAARSSADQASTAFQPTGVSVYYLPVPENGGVEGGIDPGSAVWPLDDPTAWSTKAGGSYPCATYTADDGAKALEAAKRASTQTNWSIGSTTPTTGPAGNTTSPPPFHLVFRPLLPGETDACQ